MDPSKSLSDFILTFIGIDEKIAIEKYITAKKKRRAKTRSKRRDKWMVEGLYLDMSHTEDKSDEEDCRDAGNDKGHRHGQSTVHHCTYHIIELSCDREIQHPHKVNHLATGQRGCDYFASIFQRKGASIITSHSTKLPLSCLPAIPATLDYLYNPDPTVPVHCYHSDSNSSTIPTPWQSFLI